MRKTNAERRSEFFDRGVAAYQRVMRSDQDLYFCPICEEPFGRAALADKRLTLEGGDSEVQTYTASEI